MENFNIFIEEIQKLEIRVKEFYIDNDYVIEDFTVDEAPDYLFKKGFFLDLSHYNNDSSYSEKLKILQQRALTELSNLSIEQVNIHLSRIGLILSRFSKMYDKCKAVKEKLEKGNFNKVDLELEIFSAFIVEKPQNYNLASVTESFFWDLLDAITVQKDGYLQGFDKQIRDIFNIPKEEPKIKHLPLNIEHELSQKPTITARLNYWREIKDNLTKDEFIQIYDKYIRNDLLTPDGRIWDLVSKAKDYVIHFIRSISWKLNSEFAINIVRSEIKAMEAIENEVKQLLDTGVTMKKIEEQYKDFKKEYETRKYNLNGEVVQKTKEEFDILKRKEELTEVMRVKTNHYRANLFNDYSVMIYSKYKFYKPYLEAKLKEFEHPLSGTPILEKDISAQEKAVIDKIVKNPNSDQKKFLKAFVKNLADGHKITYAIETACEISKYSKKHGYNLYKEVREGSLKFEPLSEILNKRKQSNNNNVID